MPYIPYITVTFHLLFATNQTQRIQYPHADQDVSTNQSSQFFNVKSILPHVFEMLLNSFKSQDFGSYLNKRFTC